MVLILDVAHAPPACVTNEAFATGPKPKASTVRIFPVEPMVNVVVPDVALRINPDDELKSNVPFTVSSDPEPSVICIPASSKVTPEFIVTSPLTVVAACIVFAPVPEKLKLLYVAARIVCAAPLYSTVPVPGVNVELLPQTKLPPILSVPISENFI